MHPKVQEAVEVLEQAAEQDDMGMLFTAGKDSMIMMYLWREYCDTPDVSTHDGEPLYNQPPLLIVDTYNQFDEIYDFRDEIAEEWGLKYDVRANEEFLEEVIWNDDDERGFAWDGFKTDECCGALKIDVIADFIQSGYESLIVGRREADVNGELDTTEDKREPLPHERYYPLANWSDSLVQMFIDREGIDLPDVYAQGYEHTDCVDCTNMGEDGDEWSGMSAEKKEQLANLRDMGYM